MAGVTKQYAFALWQGYANAAVSQEIFDAYRNVGSGSWSENYISTRLLIALHGLGTDLQWQEHGQRVTWQGYKYSGTPEQTYGDIAVFVRVKLDATSFIDGVAYYEAKRQYFNTDGNKQGFQALKLGQLGKILQSTHAAHVLLYDIDSAPRGATAVPAKFVEALLAGRNAQKITAPLGTELHTFGRNWVVPLGNNLRGFDLDFNPGGVAALKKFVDGLPGAVINAGVSLLPDLEPEPAPFEAASFGYVLAPM
ncbi:hypothetical protein RSP673_012520 [Ralstonia solanacearum P673]|uniref:hypothetical protein n=1 Tax=Ralstonia solanacearum TaxID=305 RepID=UPI001377D2B8|nr:hypothetical protein [Ralstonia solanacearum]MCL9852075.1 hypothetical protein [Ralstonia solanacearum]MCL9856979.1 hypothetical protein [Ralstonia solanacearum]MCL9859738.1 hypothetical protein [Ralstonia solanacearum]MCL9866582.1 hypothetical protein [Ralstonia solanacearum]MCL9871369.1 hypothetical protein [Ralstonia solanacearum]